jgi:tetratricopeptide (TPR) repeat protein
LLNVQNDIKQLFKKGKGMRIGFINYLVTFFVVLFFIFGCENSAQRKIKLADISTASSEITQTASSVLRVSPEQQRYIAILNFKNETKDPALDWLRRGLADMFVTELSQSPYLNIVPIKRISEIAHKHGQSEDQLNDPSIASVIAKEAQAEIVLTGRIYPLGDSLCIDVDLINTTSGRSIRKEMVHGRSLEQIFSMVSDLAERVRSRIRGDLEEIHYAGIDLKQMTESVEAFRYFSQGKENAEKFLRDEAIKSYEDAIAVDTTFATAYLNLAYLKFELGEEKEVNIALQKAQKYANKLSQSDKIKLQLLENLIQGNYQELIPILEEAVNRLPSDVDVRLQLATYYRQFGNYDGALREFEVAAELDPDRKMLYNELGYVHAYRGDFTSALKNIDTYIELAPDEPNPHDSKGDILMIAGRLNEAANQFKLALQKWPKFYQSATKLAQIYAEMGDKSNTFKYLDQALASTPNERAIFNINLVKARVLWKFANIKEAEKLLTKLIRGRPYSVESVIITGEMYNSIGNETAAKRVYLEALHRFQKYFNERKADFEDANNFVNLVLTADLPAKDVIPTMQKLASDESLPPLHKFVIRQTLSLMYLRTGDFDKANECREKVLSQEFDFLLTLSNNDGWGTWRHFFESLRYTSEMDAQTHPLPKRILNFARETERKDLEALACFAKARIYQLQKNSEAAGNQYQDVGAPMEPNWMVIGPFKANTVSGFDHKFPPETEIDLNASYQGANKQISWQPAEDGSHDGYVDLQSIFGYRYWTVGYGLVYAFSPEERKAQIRVGADEAFKLWLNDELISQRYYHKGAMIDRDIVTVVLHPGYNKILLKVTNSELGWGFYFRITDESGNGYYDISYHSPEEMKNKFAIR